MGDLRRRRGRFLLLFRHRCAARLRPRAGCGFVSGSALAGLRSPYDGTFRLRITATADSAATTALPEVLRVSEPFRLVRE